MNGRGHSEALKAQCEFCDWSVEVEPQHVWGAARRHLREKHAEQYEALRADEKQPKADLEALYKPIQRKYGPAFSRKFLDSI